MTQLTYQDLSNVIVEADVSHRLRYGMRTPDQFYHYQTMNYVVYTSMAMEGAIRIGERPELFSEELVDWAIEYMCYEETTNVWEMES